jgi:DNA processing protein
MRNKEYSWYMLSNASGFGAKSIHYIFNNLQKNSLSINDLFDLDYIQLSNLFPEIGKGKFSRANFQSFQNLDDEKLFNYFEKLKSDQVYIIGLDDDRYPKSVLENMGDNAPPILYCKGYLPLLNTKGVSIVGARDVDEFAIMLTKSIASKLAENALNVTSGYAKGVDTSAHLGALEAQGTTTMILSFGVNHISIKREMKDLNWEKNSLFVTQFAPYEKFSGQNAMARNKLVCAMSKAIVVIASGPERDSQGKMSGTFDAGKSALNMNIPVFVLSPQVLKPTPQGNIDLIKLGGIEFSNGIDIVNFLEEHPTIEPPVNTNGQANLNSKQSTKNTKTIIPIQTSLF